MTDPVCGKEITETEAAGRSDYQGKMYYFCSQDCKLEFDDDPDQYVGWGGESRVEGFA